MKRLLVHEETRSHQDQDHSMDHRFWARAPQSSPHPAAFVGGLSARCLAF